MSCSHNGNYSTTNWGLIVPLANSWKTTVLEKAVVFYLNNSKFTQGLLMHPEYHPPFRKKKNYAVLSRENWYCLTDQLTGWLGGCAREDQPVTSRNINMQRGSNRREDPALRSRGHKGKHRSTAGTEEQWAQGNTGHRVSGKLRPKTRETKTLSIVVLTTICGTYKKAQKHNK